MSTSTRRLRAKRASAAVAGVVSLAMVTAACGGGSGSKKTSAAGAGSTGSTKAQTLKLGAIFSLSGAVAPFSEGGVHAVELAVKQINARGGFTVGNTKYTLELDTKDDRSDPSVATASATALLEDDGVNIVLGPVTSVTAPAVAKYVGPKGGLMMSGATGLIPLLTPDAVKGPMKTVFNTSGDQATIAKHMAEALKAGYPEAKRVAAIFDDGAIGKFMGPNFATAAKSLGIEVVGQQVYPAASTDYSSALTTIKGAKPDVLFVCCTSTTNANIAKQAISLGATPAFMSWGGSLRPATSSATGKAIDQPWVVVNMPGIMEALADGTPVAPRDGELQYLKDVKSVLGKDISVDEGGALYFYDYVFMLVDAMQKAGTVSDTAKISDALSSLSFTGPTLGPIAFNASHVAQIGADLCKATSGKVSCQTLPVAH